MTLSMVAYIVSVDTYNRAVIYYTWRNVPCCD